MDGSLQVPILFNVFNRPSETRRVFEAIRHVRPKQLFISADAPRVGRIEEAQRCMEVREIVGQIDWECQTHYKFNDQNMGCGTTISTALEWFFSHVEFGIILEDDTLPSPEFFTFCEKLLVEYQENDQVFSINGCSLGFYRREEDYGATRYFNMWGWATWKRSFELVSETWYKMDSRPDIRSDKEMVAALALPTMIARNEWIMHWQEIFDEVWIGKVDTWDYQWLYTALKHGLYIIRPNRNFVVNLGFNGEATHTTETNHTLSNLQLLPNMNPGMNGYKGSLKLSKNYELDYVARKWRCFNPVKYSLAYQTISKSVKAVWSSSKKFFKNYS